MQQMGPKHISYTAKVSVHVSIERILCLIVYFCMQHAKEKEEGFFCCFSITVGSADSASDLSLSFLPILCSKTFSAFITILMSSDGQLTHMPPPCPICWLCGTSSPALQGWARLGCSSSICALLCSAYKF